MLYIIIIMLCWTRFLHLRDAGIETLRESKILDKCRGIILN
jgi:hypothetical protein